jgi:stage II sporulation protein AA (anti-sigma F factor antagonist)
MAAQGTGGIVLDLRQLRYVDSSGVNALFEFHQEFASSGRRMALVGPTPSIRRILSVLQLDRLMPIFHRLEDAVAYLRGDSDTEGERLAP